MAITVEWDNPEQTIIRWDYQGNLDWSEIWAARQQSIAMIQDVPYLVHLILDVTHSPHLLANALSNMRGMKRTIPANTGQIVMVGTTMLIRTVIQTSQKLSQSGGWHIRFADTAEAARTLLAEDTTQSDMANNVTA